MDALRKMTLMPAQRLQMSKKGRVQVGADADLTILGEDRVIDRATYENPTQFSAGIVHVLVNGSCVVRDAQLVPDVYPGKAIRREGSLLSR